LLQSITHDATLVLKLNYWQLNSLAIGCKLSLMMQL